ncbi:MAG: hypothetical protein AAGA65_09135 [Actinomycetota bacterium]
MPKPPAVEDEVVRSIESVDVSVNSFNGNQMIAIEDHFDLDFTDIADAVSGDSEIVDDDGNKIRTGKILRVLAWVKLSDDHPGITIEQAGMVPFDLTISTSEEDPDGSE